MLYDVMIMNAHGVWITDTVTGSKRRAEDRAREINLLGKTVAQVIEG